MEWVAHRLGASKIFLVRLMLFVYALQALLPEDSQMRRFINKFLKPREYSNIRAGEPEFRQINPVMHAIVMHFVAIANHVWRLANAHWYEHNAFHKMVNYV